MTNLEKRNSARNATAALLTDVLKANGAIQFDTTSWAIPQMVDNDVVWTEITVKAKMDTFDPKSAAEEWKADEEIKAEKRAEKAKVKAEKIARDKAKREAKAKAQEAEDEG